MTRARTYTHDPLFHVEAAVTYMQAHVCTTQAGGGDLKRHTPGMTQTGEAKAVYYLAS